MKTVLYILLSMVLATAGSFGQMPGKINYQGVLTDEAGNHQGQTQMEFRLYDVLTGGASLWSQAESVPVHQGAFNVMLGPFPEEIDFSVPYYLELVVEGTVLSPREELASTPYAMRAGNANHADSASRSAHADNAGRANSADIADSIADNTVSSLKIVDGSILFVDIDQNGAATGQVMKWNGSAWAVSDDNVGSGSGIFLPLAGGMMIGPISSSGDPEIKMGKGNFGSGNLNAGIGAFVAGSNNRAWGAYSVVSGGGGELARDSNSTIGRWSTVGGGSGNTASGDGSTVGGGNRNTSSNPLATIGGGIDNTAIGDFSTVGGGHTNSAIGIVSTVGGGAENRASENASTVAGGESNIAGGEFSTISGGNSNSASVRWATIGGGTGNSASGVEASTVGGGSRNIAFGSWATIGGGDGNSAPGDASTIGGGTVNNAGGRGSIVVGGHLNSAIGDFSAIPGGLNNRATGSYSLAGGYQAVAGHTGAFVWADGSLAPGGEGFFESERDNQYRIRATGGARFDVNTGDWINIYDDGTNLINTSTGARLSTGGVWTNASDRNLKENFALVDGKVILEKVASLPITIWNYKSESPSVKHIGPTAQDFYETFGLNEDDKSISTIDPSGVALAAIQQLKKENDAMRAELQKLEEQVRLLMGKMHADLSQGSSGRIVDEH